MIYKLFHGQFTVKVIFGEALWLKNPSMVIKSWKTRLLIIDYPELEDKLVNINPNFFVYLPQSAIYCTVSLDNVSEVQCTYVCPMKYIERNCIKKCSQVRFLKV